MITYAFNKTLDWSAFNSGISVPLDVQVMMKTLWGKQLERGDKIPIRLRWDDRIFQATLSNQIIASPNYPTHKDIVRILYGKHCGIIPYIQQRYPHLYSHLSMKKAQQENQRSPIAIPESLRVSLSIGLTESPYEWIIDEHAYYKTDEAFWTQGVRESDIESGPDYAWIDENASMDRRNGLIRIRQLDRTIGENLKQLYQFRCQICGQDHGLPYGAHAVEAHHIDPFASSLNNNGDNQLIICPNHHRIVHQTQARFLRDKLAYKYPNGLVEHLRLNFHLPTRGNRLTAPPST